MTRDWGWYAYAEDGTWLGQFQTEETAHAWADPRGYSVSTERPVRKPKS